MEKPKELQEIVAEKKIPESNKDGSESGFHNNYLMSNTPSNLDSNLGKKGTKCVNQRK